MEEADKEREEKDKEIDDQIEELNDEEVEAAAELEKLDNPLAMKKAEEEY